MKAPGTSNGKMSRYITRRHATLETNLQSEQAKKKLKVEEVTQKKTSASDKVSKTRSSARILTRKLSGKSKRVKLKNENDESGEKDDLPQKKKQSSFIIKRDNVSKNVLRNDTKKRRELKENAEQSKSKEEDNVKGKKTVKRINRNVPGLRQMSLKESFSKWSVSSRLKLQDKTNNSSSDKSLNAALANRRRTRKTKVPVYKSAPVEESIKCVSDIYDFKFDTNDSKERIIKKRKKRKTKKTVLNTKKKNIVKPNAHDKVTDKDKVQVTQHKEKEEEKHVEVMDDKSCGKVENKLLEELEQVDENKENVIESSFQNSIISKNDTVGHEQTADSITKPRVVLNEVFTKKVTMINSVLKTFNDSNLTVEQNNMLNHSLLQKSLSPISKPYDNFDVGSPWRAPPLFTFSQVKNMFQSTPQNNKFEISTGRYVRTASSESKNYNTETRATNLIKKTNKNGSMENALSTLNLKKRNDTIGRRFGTEITNFDQSAQLHNPATETDEQITSEVENVPSNTITEGTRNFNANNTSNFDNDDKENISANYQTPKKIAKKGFGKLKSYSPRKVQTNVQISHKAAKENTDAEPGPSGLQNSRILNEQRTLKQSNLNNFLNITEMPSSTSISTPHRIFGDGSLETVSRKFKKKSVKLNEELENVFGFDESDSSHSTPIINQQAQNVERKEAKIIKTKNVEPHYIQSAVPARLLAGEIKYNLLPNNAKNEEAENNKVQLRTRKETSIDVSNFSDTFDIQSEGGETSVDMNDFPLFVDLEPSHFTEPPKHSYKRKRAVKFSFSEDSNSDEENAPNYILRKKKVMKLNKKDDKRLRNWIKDVNQTFEEIDKHDLLVE